MAHSAPHDPHPTLPRVAHAAENPSADRLLDQLEHACEDAQQALEHRAAQLTQHRLKRWFLGKMRGLLQHDIHQVAVQFTQIAKTAQQVRTTHQLAALQQLEAQMQQLEAQKAALQKPLAQLPEIKLVDRIISHFTPPITFLWGALFGSGLLPLPAFLITGIPLVIGTGILIKTSYQRVYLLLQQAKVEDRKVLVQQIDTIVQLFAKMEEKMHASDTLALRQTVEKLEKKMQASDTMALREAVEAQAKLQGAIANKLTKLEVENAELKETNAEIKESNTELKEMVKKILKLMQGKPS